jgi:AcrR family transcriptional regulator
VFLSPEQTGVCSAFAFHLSECIFTAVSVGSVRENLRSQLRESVSTAILEAAEDLIAAKGLQGAPLAQIAKRAGVAVGTLYNYFEDRDALIRALFEMRRATLHPQLRAAVAKAPSLPFEERLRLFVRDVFAAVESHRKFVKVAIEAEHLKKSTTHDTPHDMQQAITEIVNAGIKEKRLAPASRDLIPVMLAGAIKAVMFRRIADNAPLDPKEADAVVTIFLDGARK